LAFVVLQLAKARPPALKWSLANPSGLAPSPRIDAPIAYDSVGRRVFVFGGMDASSDRNDVLAYSVDTQQWTQLNPVGRLQVLAMDTL